ncbi:MAG TPA: phosphotransferase [Steroidobacteraceae bacterium]|nr:phosphotransferase [Steroidobacteraceae bacterium]
MQSPVNGIGQLRRNSVHRLQIGHAGVCHTAHPAKALEQFGAPLGAHTGNVFQATAAGARSATLVHCDLHGSNLIEGDRLWLIDWEYAALADPLQDVASVLAYYPHAGRHSGRLLGALGLAGVTPRELLAAVWMFQLLVFLWYRVRRLAVAPTSADLAAERRAHAALVHNGNL